MKSSSTYLDYMHKMQRNKKIYSDLKSKLSYAGLRFNWYTKNINNAYSCFVSGYQEENGATLTGDVIVNLKKSSENINSSIDKLVQSIESEIEKAGAAYQRFSVKYVDALRREREEAEKAAKEKAIRRS